MTKEAQQSPKARFMGEIGAKEYRDHRIEWLPTLRTVLLVLAAGSLAIAVGIRLFAPAEAGRMAAPLLMALIAIVGLAAYQSGRLGLGRSILTYGVLAVIALSMFFSGGVHSAAMLAIAPLVITASVISPQTGRRMVLMSGTLLVIVGLAEYLQWLPMATPMPWGQHWLLDAIVLAVAAGIGRYLNILLHARTAQERSIAEQLEREKAALAAREQQLRMIAENIPAFIFQGDRDLRCRFANRRYAEFFGFTPEGIVGRRVADILGEAAALAIQPKLQAVLSGETVRYRAVRRSAADGGERHLDITFVPERDEHGEVVGFYALKLDVTAEVRAEQSLRKNEELLRLATDGGSVGIWEWDIATSALSWNPQLKRIFGLAADTDGLTLDRFVAAIHPGDSERVKHSYRSALEQKTEFDCEYRIVRPDGSVRWIIARGHGDYDEAGQARRMVGMAIDTTELRLSEAALLESEERLKEAQRIGHVGSWELDLVSQRLTWSDEIFRIYERDPGSFGGTFEDLLTLVHPDDLALIRRAFRESAQVRGGYEIVHRIVTPGGKVKHLRVHWEVFFDADGKPVRALGTARDITEHEMARAEIRRLNDELEARVRARTTELQSANRELESFAYSISHDLRAPLRGIDGFGQLLLEEYGERLDEQGQDYLKRMRRAAQRMGTLIDDILELSRVSRKSMGREAVDLSRMAHDILDNKMKSNPQRQVEAIIAPGCTASGDPQLLRVLMENLLENAWKYTRTRPLARIEFGQQLKDGEMAFFVRDNGVGFDMHYAGRLFGPFQRLHKPEEFEGTGIGLASAARVVHRHGGHIWAEAEPGQGATFRFTLAGDRDATQPDGAAPDGAPRGGAGSPTAPA